MSLDCHKTTNDNCYDSRMEINKTAVAIVAGNVVVAVGAAWAGPKYRQYLQQFSPEERAKIDAVNEAGVMSMLQTQQMLINSAN